MIAQEKTKEEFGHNISDLSYGSNRKIYVKCDYCEMLYVTTYKIYNKGREVIEKDGCKQCKYIKRKDISLALYGVENSAQRPEVRKKISENCEGFDDKRRKSMKKKYGVTNPMESDELKARHKLAILDKYGVENVSQVREIREKVEQTNLKKFGDKQFLASEIGREKIKEGMLNKYGVENAFQSEDVKKLIRETNLENLGVEMPTQSKEVMDKIQQTNIERYGYKSPSQNDEIKKKIVNTNIERYGYKHQFERPEIQAQSKETNIEKYGYEYPTQCEEIKNKIIDTKIKNGDIKTFDNKTMKELATEYDKPYSTFIAQVAKYGYDVAIQIQKKENSLEKVMELFLIEQKIEYKKHGSVDKRRYDFLIPSHNLIIETDGLYWHSDAILKEYDYHIVKREVYIQNGYTPLFFREDEINNKFDIVKSIILNKIGKSVRVFARKCSIIEVSKIDSKEFFEQNHLMGNGRGTTYGLMYNNVLVSSIIIKRTKNQNYEISRFCHKLGYQVVGGFSRLIKQFLRGHDVELLTTFIDRRYGSGEYLTSLGFKFVNCSPSFCWTNTKECVHRLRFCGNTGYNNGFIKLWDCGQARYDLQT